MSDNSESETGSNPETGSTERIGESVEDTTHNDGASGSSSMGRVPESRRSLPAC